MMRTKLYESIAVWFCLLMAMGIGACSQRGSDAPEMLPQELVARMASEAPPVVLDVRTPQEYTAGHVPGAINVPHKALPERLAEVLGFRDREVVVYCERGKRSIMAEAVLREAGFSSIQHLQGHMAEWRRQRLPEHRGKAP
jgi:rhodanese-related sulfurtransferase